MCIKHACLPAYIDCVCRKKVLCEEVVFLCVWERMGLLLEVVVVACGWLSVQLLTFSGGKILSLHSKERLSTFPCMHTYTRFHRAGVLNLDSFSGLFEQNWTSLCHQENRVSLLNQYVRLLFPV